MVLLAAVFGGMMAAGIGPLLREPGDPVITLAYAMGGISIVILVAALMFVRQQVPERRPGQSVQAFWSEPAVISKVHLVWFLLEGAAMLSLIAFLLTGHVLPAVAGAACIVAFWMNGPNAFAKP